MKRPTPAAWRKYLAAYEQVMNALLQDTELSDERISLYRIHDMLRRRARGEDAQKESAGDGVSQRS